MTCRIDLRDLIQQEAISQGVDPSIALAVAQQESGTCQWRTDGSIVVSSAGAIGVFQLMPATAAGLGVDPTDVNQNIRGGIAYLKQLYQKYQNWPVALAAYNAGSGTLAKGILPTETKNYVTSIAKMLPTSNSSGAVAASVPATPSPLLLPVAQPGAPNLKLGLLVVGGFVIVAWAVS